MVIKLSDRFWSAEELMKRKTLLEVNVPKVRTGLPYDIWIDSSGSVRNVPHSKPRLEVKVDGVRIPVSIEDEPKILVDKKIPKFGTVSHWMKNKKSVLMQHWNHEIDDDVAVERLSER